MTIEQRYTTVALNTIKEFFHDEGYTVIFISLCLWLESRPLAIMKPHYLTIKVILGIGLNDFGRRKIRNKAVTLRNFQIPNQESLSPLYNSNWKRTFFCQMSYTSNKATKQQIQQAK